LREKAATQFNQKKIQDPNTIAVQSNKPNIEEKITDTNVTIQDATSSFTDKISDPNFLVSERKKVDEQDKQNKTK
jgi:hypothetical protein